jgi:outer membrane protein insertion porin family
MLKKLVFPCCLIAALLLACFSTPLQAQPDLPLDYDDVQEYEIAGIEVQGAEYTDAKGIISISGLRVGSTLRLPGDAIGRAIRQLWKQGLFVDVNIELSRKVGSKVFLNIVVKEQPRYARKAYRGVRKGLHDDLNGVVDRYLQKGKAATETMKQNAVQAIKKYFEGKGYLDTEVNVIEEEDVVLKNSVRWVFDIKRGKKIRIKDIVFHGASLKPRRLRRSLKETKRFHWLLSIFKASRYNEEDYQDDQKKLLAYYHTIGRRDASIIRDSVYYITDKRGKKWIKIDMYLDEGNVYYFGDISFRGNSIYSNEYLREILGIRKGDVFNQELLQSRLSFDRNGRDISTLYMDNGHLMFQANPVEKGVNNDTVDIEVRLQEGPIFTIDQVVIKGNDRTHEHVIRRELRTLPGEKFSRSDIIRSQREIMALNYFDPESMGINTPINPQRGTVDIEYTVKERPSDQLELSAGWGGFGRGLIGTLGVTFNNFSAQNMFVPEAWSPLPQGDGQRLSLRVQTNGRFFQSYNFSFTEPWLGGRKPQALTLSAYQTRINNGFNLESSSFSQLIITGVTLGLGTRLRFPDDFFTYQGALNYQQMDLVRRIDFTIPTGKFNNFSISQTISRNSLDEVLFPRQGSILSLTVKLAPPYSLFSRKDYSQMADIDKFKWIEYHKWDFETEWYTPLSRDKQRRLVLKLSAKMGFLGYYNKNVGLSPFERYELGGDGISNFVGLQGRDIVSLRGYRDPVNDVSEANRLGAPIYNKFTAELRYLISPNPSATIFVLGFVQGGNAWSNMKEYNPFNLRRSAGLGLRVFLPMFGTLGFDYGIGFDKNLGGSKNPFDYGAFNIVLGFEPR